MDKALDAKYPWEDASQPRPSHRTQNNWHSELMLYMQNIKRIASEKSAQHDSAGHYFHELDVRWGLPSVLIPAVLAPIIILVGLNTGDTCDTLTATDYVSTSGFVLTSFVTSINGYFRYGSRSTTHHLYASKYTNIITDIDAELIKSPAARMDGNVFLTTVKMKYDNLVFGEPVVPAHLIQPTVSSTCDTLE